MNPFENFLYTGSPSALIESGMPIVIASLILFFLILAVILSYHWRRYGVSRVKAAIFMWTYLIGGLVLIGIMLTAKMSY